MRILKFAAKCILALLPFILLVGYTALNPMGYMDEEYPSWKYVKDVEKGRISPVDKNDAALILGDSRAMADIIATRMGENYVNLGMGGATSIEMYYTLKEYIENNGAPKRVFIMFAPFHYSYMDNYRTRTVYFHHLSLIDVLSVYRKGRMGDDFYGGEPDAIDEVDLTYIFSSYFRLPNVYLPALINSHGFSRTGINRNLYNEQVSQRGHALYGTMDGCDYLNYEATYTQMDRGREHRLITRYFALLLKLCDENDIETFVLQAPMNEASYKALDAGYVSEYTSYMEQFRNDNPGMTFEISIPCYDNAYFGDSSHLNGKGAEVYTGELLDRYIK